jgi:hypothetical protein
VLELHALVEGSLGLGRAADGEMDLAQDRRGCLAVLLVLMLRLGERGAEQEAKGHCPPAERRIW